MRASWTLILCVLVEGVLVALRAIVNGSNSSWHTGDFWWWVWMASVIVVATILGSEITRLRFIGTAVCARQIAGEFGVEGGRRHYNPGPPIDS